MAGLSQKRQAVYMRQRYLRDRGLLPPVPTKPCGVCGIEFVPNRNRHGEARFCRECSKKHGRNKCERIVSGHVHKKCVHCGNEFEATTGVQRYCSKTCKELARARNENPEQNKVRKRAWYHERGGKEWTKEYRKNRKDYLRLQARLYKARHPDKIAEQKNGYRDRRNKRIAEQSDGTAGGMIAALMKLKKCQYCGHHFASEADKRIDHRDPVAYGGQHSAANLELCCDRCNSRKAAMPFVEWIATLPEPHKSRAVSRAERARGAPLTQEALPLFGGTVIKRKKNKGIDPALAKRDAMAAWKRWIHELAPSEWLDGYYAATGKPWTDHRLTDALAFGVRYRCDPAFKRKWLDARNKRRAIRRIDDPGYDKPKRSDDKTLPMWGNCE